MLASLVLVGFALSSAPECTEPDAHRAQTAVASAKSWQALYRSFDRFQHCDDGTVAEAYTDSVAILLSDRWSEIKKLGALVSRDPHFKSFVLHHLDETVPASTLEQISRNANHSCPIELTVLCAEISVTILDMK